MISGRETNTVVYLADTVPLRAPAVFDALLASVSEDRRRKTERLRFPQGKYLSLGAEYLLMLVCRDMGIEYTGLRLRTGDRGKPDFAELPMHFNLSHSGEAVMCAVSPLPVGCDIEAVRPYDPALVKRFFHPEESLFLENASPEKQAELFTRLWTRKESFIKCTGDGFSRPIGSFCLLPPADPNARDILAVPDGGMYAFREIVPPAGYSCSVCLQLPEAGSEDISLTVRRVTITAP